METDLSVIVTTFERPRHLRRVLLSLAVQQDFAGRLEVIVADDGSQDETPQVVEEFASQVSFPVRFVTHQHEGFWPARTRNEGFAASSGRYILFLDGDCVVPPDHLAIHMRMRRPGRAYTGDCVRLDPQTSEKITEDVVRRAEYLRWTCRGELRRLAIAHWKAVFYHLIRHPEKPRVLTGNLALWREDFLRINGFDENYRGWGCEDDDFGLRLHQAGIRVCSIRRWTRTYHLWHPRVATAPQKVSNGVNFRYLHRAGRLTKCRNGFKKRPWSEVCTVWTGNIELLPRLSSVPGISRGENNSWRSDDSSAQSPEVEILVWDNRTPRFKTRAECRVLVIPDGPLPPKSLVRQADIVFAKPGSLDSLRAWIRPEVRLWSLDQIHQAFEAIG